MKQFVISDTHFGHSNIIKYCNRPFKNTKDMDAQLIKNWNEAVSEEDEVFHLGDFSLSRNAEYVESIVKKLNGTKHLILGNHDYLSPWRYIECGFASVHTSLNIKDVVMAHDPASAATLAEGSTLLHGHVHNLWTCKHVDNGVKLINFSVEVIDYRPVTMESRIEGARRWV